MPTTSQIWIAEDDRSLRWVMEKAISRDGIDVRSFETGDDLLSALRNSQPEIIISDIRMPGIDGLELLAEIHASWPQIPVIITTAHSDLDSAVAAYQGGAFEYLPKPFDLKDLVEVARRGLLLAKEQKSLSVPEVLEGRAVQEIIGEAPAMQEVFRAIGRLSNSNITVLINGESGTGKELVAQALHKHSPRRDAKFIALNMAAIPHDLIESELFGHEKGAFTGAATRREGRFEQSNGGTLFLDEIGDMPPEAQTRLLRVLADGEFLSSRWSHSDKSRRTYYCGYSSKPRKFGRRESLSRRFISSTKCYPSPLTAAIRSQGRYSAANAALLSPRGQRARHGAQGSVFGR